MTPYGDTDAVSMVKQEAREPELIYYLQTQGFLGKKQYALRLQYFIVEYKNSINESITKHPHPPSFILIL